MKTAIAIVLAFLGASAAPANAGNEAHGGLAVKCTTQPTVMLDYYNASLPTIGGPAPALKDVSNFNADEVVAFFRSRFSGFPAFLEQFNGALNIIEPLSNWIAVDLSKVGDSGEVYQLPPNCVAEQAAARQGKVMFGDPSVIAQLSPAQQGVLLVHEALYYIGDTTAGLKTSENVRAVIRQALPVNYSLNDLSTAIKSIGGLVSPWLRHLNDNYGQNGEIYRVTQASAQSVRLDIWSGPNFYKTETLSCGPNPYACTVKEDGSQFYDIFLGIGLCKYTLSADASSIRKTCPSYPTTCGPMSGGPAPCAADNTFPWLPN